MSESKWAEKSDEREAAAGNPVCTRCGLPLAPGEAERDCMTGVVWRRHNAERCVQLLRETADGLRVVAHDAGRQCAEMAEEVGNLRRAAVLGVAEQRSANEAAAKMEAALRDARAEWVKQMQKVQDERDAAQRDAEAAGKTAAFLADESDIRRAFAERVADALRGQREVCVENALRSLRQSMGGTRAEQVAVALAYGNAADELNAAAACVWGMVEDDDAGEDEE